VIGDRSTDKLLVGSFQNTILSICPAVLRVDGCHSEGNVVFGKEIKENPL